MEAADPAGFSEVAVDAGPTQSGASVVATGPAMPETIGDNTVPLPRREEELPYSASARLGVLRVLFFAPGTEGGAGDGSRVEREAGRSSYARGSFSATEPEFETAAASPLNVMAQPEFLRPKQVAPVDKEKEPLRPVPTPPRKDPSDDLETLPSWRGQYRKKRYPSA